MKKAVLYNSIIEEVVKLNLKDGYIVVFLSTMVLRKVRHPEEKMEEIATKVMKKMPERYGMKELSEPEDQKLKEISMKVLNKDESEYGKKNLTEVSAKKTLRDLEVALQDANLPEDWLRGYPVSTVVKNLAEIIRKKFDNVD